MSLVNKMLRDLDARRIGDSDRAALPTSVTPLAARQEPNRALLLRLLFGLLVAAVLAVAAWFATPTRNREAPAARPADAASAESVGASASAPATKVGLPFLRMADELSTVPAPTRRVQAAAPKMPEQVAVGVVAPRPPVVASPRVPPVLAEARIDKQARLPSPAERAEIEYRRGVLAQRQGNAEEAAGNYRAALEDHPEHAAARQTLAALLIEAKRFDDAEELLRTGTELAPVRLASTLALARLKVERNQAPAALELLLKNAATGERSAEYQGFSGALLNRAGRAPEAVERYQAATRLAPGEGRWWAGLGIALDSAGKGLEAREAYQKARALPGLPADLAQHVEQRLR